MAREEKQCRQCGRIFSSVRCPRCEYTARPDKFKQGCPVCGYSNPIKPDVKKGNFKKSKNIEYGSVPPWVWVSALVLLALALAAFLGTILG